MMLQNTTKNNHIKIMIELQLVNLSLLYLHYD